MLLQLKTPHRNALLPFFSHWYLQLLLLFDPLLLGIGDKDEDWPRLIFIIFQPFGHRLLISSTLWEGPSTQWDQVSETFCCLDVWAWWLCFLMSFGQKRSCKQQTAERGKKQTLFCCQSETHSCRRVAWNLSERSIWFPRASQCCILI